MLFNIVTKLLQLKVGLHLETNKFNQSVIKTIYLE